MGIAWCWARVELRHRWRAWLAIALLIGIGGGLAMASLSGARRTHSALPRFLEQAVTPDLVVDPDLELGDSEPFLDAVEALPGVAHRSDARSVALGRVVDGRIDPGSVGNAMASVDGDRFYEHDRVRLTHGRLPDPSRQDEVLVSASLAAEGIEVGDRLDYRIVDLEVMFDALERGDVDLPADVGTPLTLEVTGVGIFPELAVVEAEYAQDRLLVTPALYDVLPPTAHLWDRTGLHLAEGADIAVVRREIQEIASEMGGSTLFEVRADITARAQRAVRPYVLALAGLGVAGAAFVVLLTTQVLRRTIAQSERDHQILRSLAADGLTLRLVLALPVLLAAAAAATVAVAVTASVSLLTPVGPVRAIEPNPGVAVDWTVVATGIAVLVSIAVLPVVLAARRWTRSGRAPGQAAGRAMTWAQQMGAPLGMVVGIGKATGVGARPQQTSARAGLVSVGLAIGMLVTIVTFSASLNHLIDHPEVHGWNTDVALLGADGYGTFDLRSAAEVEGVESMTGVVYGSFTVGDVDIAGMGVVLLRGALLPPIVDGHAPTRPDEVLLGQKSLDQTGATIGDTVAVRVPGDEEPVPMTVVGTAVFPGLGQLDNDRPTLAEGALVVLPEEAIDEIDMGWSVVLAELGPDADPDVVVADLVDAADELAGETDVFEVLRPADIAAFARLGRVPVLLAGLLSAVALASLVHVLLVSTRSWRRDRAVLAALGAAPADLRTAVRWHAVTVITFAVVAAVPMGSILGRWAWRSLAEDIGIVPDPVLPIPAMVLVVVGLFAAGSLATIVPNRRASRMRPATYLRAE